MKKTFLIFSIIILALAFFITKYYGLPTKSQAMRRINKFTNLVNYHEDNPKQIYKYLTKEYRNSITSENFEIAFVKENTYPYLTTFFINFESIEMDKNNLSGIATFSQAARLPGMVYKIPFIYEDGNYYMIMDRYNKFPDGSYLEKFEHIPHYLVEGWK